MGSGLKNKKTRGMGNYGPTDEELKAQMWCIDQGIQIYPFPIARGMDPGAWYVEIKLGNKKPHRSKESFGPVEIWETIFNYYKYYYGKRRD